MLKVKRSSRSQYGSKMVEEIFLELEETQESEKTRLDSEPLLQAIEKNLVNIWRAPRIRPGLQGIGEDLVGIRRAPSIRPGLQAIEEDFVSIRRDLSIRPEFQAIEENLMSIRQIQSIGSRLQAIEENLVNMSSSASRSPVWLVTFTISAKVSGAIELKL